MAKQPRGRKVLLSTRTGFRRYRVAAENLSKKYVRVTPGREDARRIRQMYPKFRRGQAYYVRKHRARLVILYGIARKRGTRQYFFVGDWVSHLKPGPTSNEILLATFQTFENAGFNLYRADPTRDRVTLDANVGVYAIDFYGGATLLTLDEYKRALEARIAESSETEE